MSEYVQAYIKTCEAYGWSGGPGFNTRIVPKLNGRERRNADWDQPQHSYEVPFQNITQPLYAPIKQMHLHRRGAWGVFLYRDRLDWQAEDELFAVAEAGQDEFQLAKTSVIDGVAYLRYVYALYVPDPASSASSYQEAADSDVAITVDGTPTSAYTLDRDRGTVLFDPPMAGGEVLRWSGTFSLWVRFQNDKLPFSIDNRSGGQYVTNGSVQLLEMPPPELTESS